MCEVFLSGQISKFHFPTQGQCWVLRISECVRKCVWVLTSFDTLQFRSLRCPITTRSTAIILTSQDDRLLTSLKQREREKKKEKEKEREREREYKTNQQQNR